MGFIKLNIDSGWAGKEGTGFGLIARSDTAAPMLAASCYQDCRYDPAVAEALALRWGLELALNVEIERVQVELDAQVVIRAMNSPSCSSSLEHIIQDCKALAREFQAVDFHYVNRTANNVAHTLAAMADRFPTSLWWTDLPLPVDEALSVDSFFI